VRLVAVAVAGLLATGTFLAPARADRVPAAPAKAAHKVAYRAEMMGTVIDVTLWTADDDGAAAAVEAVFDEMKRIDTLMSNWVPTSDVSRINAAAGGAAVKVTDETFQLIRMAQQVSKKTGGAFDITVGAYHGLWKFDQDNDGSIPDPAEVKTRTKLVGWRGVALDARHSSVRLKKKGMAITLGGIAKGYSVDRAVAILRKRGFPDFIVQAGGDLYVGGRRGNQPWRVGIRDPRGARDAPFALTEIENHTFSTSGDYERFVVKDGVRYHHIIDPHSGFPAKLSRSVTVLASDAVTADAWSTALFVLGPKKGLPLARKMGLEAVYVDPKNQVTSSKGLPLIEGDVAALVKAGLAGKLLLLHPPTDGV
jgi:thiamine biosynthesis lipoprotein